MGDSLWSREDRQRVNGARKEYGDQERSRLHVQKFGDHGGDHDAMTALDQGQRSALGVADCGGQG